MSTPNKYEGHTPGPWRWENVAGAGLQITGNMPETFTFGEGVVPKGVEVKVFGLPDTTRVYRNGESLIAYERWVRFEPTEWNVMQEANARLIADAPALLAENERLREALRAVLGVISPRWESLTTGGRLLGVYLTQKNIADIVAALAEGKGEGR